MRVLIVGCGYVGTALGQALVTEGHRVFGLRRTEKASNELENCRIELLSGDITQPETLRKLPGPFDWIVNTVSSSQGGPLEYRRIYVEGTRNLLTWFKQAPPEKLVYTSSTSVYGQTDGSVVTEASPTEPAAETAKLLVETEKLLLGAAIADKVPAVILRVAGIYGPGRGHLFQQYLKGEAKMTGTGDRLFNMIHLQDLVGIIIAALKKGRHGEIYNAVDDEPVLQLKFFQWLAETLANPMPPLNASQENSARKRGLTNKKVSNQKVKLELQYKFTYPTFRQGYSAEIERLEQLRQSVRAAKIDHKQFDQ